MAVSLRKGLRSLIRTTDVSDNPPDGQRALLAKTDGWYDRDSTGAELKLAPPGLFFQDTVPSVHGGLYQRFDSLGNWYIEDGLP